MIVLKVEVHEVIVVVIMIVVIIVVVVVEVVAVAVHTGTSTREVDVETFCSVLLWLTNLIRQGLQKSHIEFISAWQRLK